MVLINGNWEEVKDLQDISKIIRENFNAELADELDKLIPEHTDEEYESLEEKLEDSEFDNRMLKNEVDDSENVIDKLQDDIKHLVKEIEFYEEDDTIENALEVAFNYGQSDGTHHKMWVIDQMVRILCGNEEEYNKWVKMYQEPNIDNDYYEWETGIAP